MSIFTPEQKEDLDRHIMAYQEGKAWSSYKYDFCYPECKSCGYEFCKAESKDDEICDTCLEMSEKE